MAKQPQPSVERANTLLKILGKGPDVEAENFQEVMLSFSDQLGELGYQIKACKRDRIRDTAQNERFQDI